MEVVDLIETKSDHQGLLFSPLNEKLLKPVCQATYCRSNVGKRVLAERLGVFSAAVHRVRG